MPLAGVLAVGVPDWSGAVLVVNVAPNEVTVGSAVGIPWLLPLLLVRDCMAKMAPPKPLPGFAPVPPVAVLLLKVALLRVKEPWRMKIAPPIPAAPPP